MQILLAQVLSSKLTFCLKATGMWSKHHGCSLPSSASTDLHSSTTQVVLLAWFPTFQHGKTQFLKGYFWYFQQGTGNLSYCDSSWAHRLNSKACSRFAHIIWVFNVWRFFSPTLEHKKWRNCSWCQVHFYIHFYTLKIKMGFCQPYVSLVSLCPTLDARRWSWINQCTSFFSMLNIMRKLVTPWTLIDFSGHERKNVTSYTACKCSTILIYAYSQTHHITEQHRLPGTDTECSKDTRALYTASVKRRLMRLSHPFSINITIAMSFFYKMIVFHTYNTKFTIATSTEWSQWIFNLLLHVFYIMLMLFW